MVVVIGVIVLASDSSLLGGQECITNQWRAQVSLDATRRQDETEGEGFSEFRAASYAPVSE